MFSLINQQLKKLPENRSQQPKTQAIVIGASMAGLLAARILTNHFDRVTVIERDILPKQPELRRGVPQANHVHVLMTRGLQILEQLFPGLEAELVAAKVPKIDWTAEFSLLVGQAWTPRLHSDLIGFLPSRALLEWLVRCRLKTYDNLEFLDGCHVKRLLTNPDRSRVTGVELHYPLHHPALPPQALQADFVVDASGRNSSLPKWLEELGYMAPEQTVVNSFLGYSTRWYERSQTVQSDWKGIGISIYPPDRRRGGILFLVEGDRWVLTMTGIADDRPPTDESEFLEFVKSLHSPVFYEAIQTAKPLSPVYAYRNTENCWRHYENLARFPEGIVALGDAVCAFNPVYGQGMTTAALSALKLDQCLRQSRQPKTTPSVKGLSRRFQKQLAQMLNDPWLMATSEDFRWDTTEGKQPGRMTRLMQRYIDQVLLLAPRQPAVWRSFIEVVHMINPPSTLFRPVILMQVLMQVLMQGLRQQVQQNKAAVKAAEFAAPKPIGQ